MTHRMPVPLSIRGPRRRPHFPQANADNCVAHADLTARLGVCQCAAVVKAAGGPRAQLQPIHLILARHMGYGADERAPIRACVAAAVEHEVPVTASSHFALRFEPI